MHAQITLQERYAISGLRQSGLSLRAISRELSRSPSTISRELARNRTTHDGAYRAERAHSYTRTRRSRSRRNSRFGADDCVLVDHLICLDWSEQVSGWLKLRGLLSHQLRDDLPARVGRQGGRRGSVATHAPGDQEAPQAPRRLRQPRKTRR